MVNKVLKRSKMLLKKEEKKEEEKNFTQKGNQNYNFATKNLLKKANLLKKNSSKK